jgi:uridine phosphorylase
MILGISGRIHKLAAHWENHKLVAAASGYGVVAANASPGEHDAGICASFSEIS